MGRWLRIVSSAWVECIVVLVIALGAAHAADASKYAQDKEAAAIDAASASPRATARRDIGICKGVRHAAAPARGAAAAASALWPVVFELSAAAQPRHAVRLGFSTVWSLWRGRAQV